MGKNILHTPLGGMQLTDLALRTLGIEPVTAVPLVELPWRPDERDRRGSARG